MNKRAGILGGLVVVLGAMWLAMLAIAGETGIAEDYWDSVTNKYFTYEHANTLNNTINTNYALYAAHLTAADPHTGYVLESLYNAHTIAYATTDDTPAALEVGEQKVVGRVTGGNIAALTIDSDLQSTSSDHDTLPSAKAVLDILKAGWTVSLADLVEDTPVLVTHLSFVAGEAIGVNAICYMKTDTTNGGRMYLYNADSTDADNDTYRFFGKASTTAAGDGSAVTIRLFSPMWVMRDDTLSLTYNQDEGMSLVVAESGTGYEVLYSSAPSGEGDHVEFTGLILQVQDAGAGTHDTVLFFGGFDMNVIPAAAP